MIQIQNTILSDDIFEEHFICNLTKCKGACCVEGDSGAPLEQEEFEQIKSILPEIWNYLSPQAQQLIEAQGIAYTDYDGELVTSIINGRECVFTYFDEDGTCKCSIEKANREGRILVQKPISCHLYPIRVTEYSTFTAMNYHEWEICNDACILGKELKVPVYKFLKTPLIRKYGEEFYETLCDAAEEWNREFNS